tara:strand:+ start:658 stop:1071 length:414 start_codon:yes stop_codon:yes gene_type:complete
MSYQPSPNPDFSVFPCLSNAVNKAAGKICNFSITGLNDITNLSAIRWEDSVTAQPSDSNITTAYNTLLSEYPMHKLKAERNVKLAETDWMAVADRTQTDAEKTYRQALRDLPTTSSSPTYNLETGVLGNVNWPTKPS